MEEKLVSVNYVGGLGNQLFQIYTTISFAIDTNRKFIFEYKDVSPSITFRKTYWNNLLKNLDTVDEFTMKKYSWTKINENHIGEYSRDYINLHENIIFDGYFQSYKNFWHNKKQINEILQIKQQLYIIREKYKHYFKTKTIGIHFRMGDYKTLQQHHPLLPDDYYINALIKLGIDNKKLMVFCEKEDFDSVNSRIRNILSKINMKCDYTLFYNDNEIEDFLLLSNCDEIICANSTFSWFSAFISDTEVVCLPYKWFHTNISNGLICPLWRIITF